VSDERTTSTYEITTSLQKPKSTQEQNTEYGKINPEKIKEILENYIVSWLFRYKLNLQEECPANVEVDKEVSYNLYNVESET
jgi:hypothetical protein